MSVVNRMLLDIDRRRAAAAGTGATATSDVRSVSSSPRAKANASINAGTLLIGAALVLVVAALLWSRPRDSQTAAVVATTVLPSAPAPEPAATASAPVVAAPNPVESTVAKTSPAREPLQPADRLKLSMQLSALVADAPTEPVAKPAREVKPSVTPSAPAVSAPPPAQAPAPTPTQAPSRTTITTQPVRQVASDETIAAARLLWNDGARAGALSTLRDALATAEATKTQKAIAPLARELARLEVVDGRPQEGLELLKRLENEFAEDADAWALRGNAEQRLGLHADAAQSHLIALRIRPNEGKWMIGAAISLAALGKMNEAQNWAERARELNAVTPAIATYLQQLGIATRR
jgi:hypothetical protein